MERQASARPGLSPRGDARPPGSLASPSKHRRPPGTFRPARSFASRGRSASRIFALAVKVPPASRRPPGTFRPARSFASRGRSASRIFGLAVKVPPAPWNLPPGPVFRLAGTLGLPDLWPRRQSTAGVPPAPWNLPPGPVFRLAGTLGLPDLWPRRQSTAGVPPAPWNLPPGPTRRKTPLSATIRRQIYYTPLCPKSPAYVSVAKTDASPAQISPHLHTYGRGEIVKRWMRRPGRSLAFRPSPRGDARPPEGARNERESAKM